MVRRMARKQADTDELRRKDRVVAVEAIKDIPVGAVGTVKMVVGQSWTRYLVAWDTGEWIGTIDGSKIVREDRLDRLLPGANDPVGERDDLVAIGKPELEAASQLAGIGLGPQQNHDAAHP